MKKKLSNRETDIMNILWESEQPFTASGIARTAPELSINTIQVVLKNLLKKSYIKVADIIYSGTVLTRAYKPVLTKGEYISSQILEDKGLTKDLLETLIEKTDDSVIAELEELLKARREKLQKSETKCCGTCLFYNGEPGDGVQFCDEREIEIIDSGCCYRWRKGN